MVCRACPFSCALRASGELCRAFDFDGGLDIAGIGLRAIDGDYATRLDSPDLTAASVLHCER